MHGFLRVRKQPALLEVRRTAAKADGSGGTRKCPLCKVKDDFGRARLMEGMSEGFILGLFESVPQK